jgi:sodium transport system permease protein
MWIVLKKELLELLRERRTLIFTFLMPTVIIPLLMMGFGLLIGHKSGQEAERVLKYAVVGIENAPELDERLHATPKLLRVPLVSTDLIDESLKSQRLDFVLVIPPGFEHELAAGHHMSLELHYNDAVKFDTTARRLRLLTTAYSAMLRERYLAAHQIDDAAQHFVTEPLSLVVKS